MSMKKSIASGFFDDLILRLTNADMPNSRPTYHIETPEGVAYFVLTRTR